jgi:hypothetical protein
MMGLSKVSDGDRYTDRGLALREELYHDQTGAHKANLEISQDLDDGGCVKHRAIMKRMTWMMAVV